MIRGEATWGRECGEPNLGRGRGECGGATSVGGGRGGGKDVYVLSMALYYAESFHSVNRSKSKEVC